MNNVISFVEVFYLFKGSYKSILIYVQIGYLFFS